MVKSGNFLIVTNVEVIINNICVKSSHDIIFGPQVRRLVKCVVVIVVSDDYDFLATFAQWSLKLRLLAGSTRMLLLTKLPFYRVEKLLGSYWTLSMMNAMLINQEEESNAR